MQERLSYKGVDYVIDYDDEDHAEVSIDDRKVKLVRHGGQLPMWTCENAYFMSDDIDVLIHHLVDYWYIIVDQNTAPAEGPGHGAMPIGEGGVLPARGRALDLTDDHAHDGDDGEKKDKGHAHGGGSRRKRGGG